jgi:long-chain acyl-CoA synthetase
MSPHFHPLLKVPYYTEEDIAVFKEKAIPVQPSTSEQETAVYRSILSPNELVKDFPEIKTIYDLFNFSVKNYPKNQMLGTRYPSREADGTVSYSKYQFKTYQEVSIR